MSVCCSPFNFLFHRLLLSNSNSVVPSSSYSLPELINRGQSVLTNTAVGVLGESVDICRAALPGSCRTICHFASAQQEVPSRTLRDFTSLFDTNNWNYYLMLDATKNLILWDCLEVSVAIIMCHSPYMLSQIYLTNVLNTQKITNTWAQAECEA